MAHQSSPRLEIATDDLSNLTLAHLPTINHYVDYRHIEATEDGDLPKSMLQDLPTELLLLIIAYVPYTRWAYQQLRSVCKVFDQTITTNTDTLKKSLVENQFWQEHLLLGPDWVDYTLLGPLPEGITLERLDYYEEQATKVDETVSKIIKLTKSPDIYCDYSLIRAGFMLIEQRRNQANEKPMQRQFKALSCRPSTDSAIRAASVKLVDAAINRYESILKDHDDEAVRNIIDVLSEATSPLSIESLLLHGDRSWEDISCLLLDLPVLSQGIFRGEIRGDTKEIASAIESSNTIFHLTLVDTAEVVLSIANSDGYSEIEIKEDPDWLLDLPGTFSGWHLINHSPDLDRTMRLAKASLWAYNNTFSEWAYEKATIDQMLKRHAHSLDTYRDFVESPLELERNLNARPQEGARIGERRRAPQPLFDFDGHTSDPKEMRRVYGVESAEQVLTIGRQDWEYYLTLRPLWNESRFDNERLDQFFGGALVRLNEIVGIKVLEEEPM